MPTREEILAAAETVIREHGITRATTQRIAQVARCSEGSIYNHFANKDDLVACAVGERMAILPGGAGELVTRAGTGSVEGNLREVARSAIAFFQHIAPMLSVLMGAPESMRARAAAIDAAGHGPRWVLRGIVEYLEAEQELGRVSPGASLEAAAQCLLGACLQQGLLTHTWGPDLLTFDDDAAATQIARAVVHGLVSPATTSNGASA